MANAMGAEKFKEFVVKNESYILSDGTLNMNHLLPKAYDLISNFKLAEDDVKVTSLKYEILEMYTPDAEDMIQINAHGLFFAQYHNMCELQDHVLASEVWHEDIYNLFQEISPDGYTFGSSEGDGACIGWFKCVFVEDNF